MCVFNYIGLNGMYACVCVCVCVFHSLYVCMCTVCVCSMTTIQENRPAISSVYLILPNFWTARIWNTEAVELYSSVLG
jgi:hypothetical protein